MFKPLMISIGLVISLIGCATSESIDRSILNHPSMNLRTKATISPASLLSGLDAISNASSASICSTCVK
ncbi:MAG: hypothetical protein AB8G05_13130 [Oligoflexales bacterium]